MRKSYCTVLVVLTLSGCGQSEFDRTKADFELREKNGATDAELCVAAGKVKDAAAAQGRSDDYTLWRTKESLHCLRNENNSYQTLDPNVR